jgi:hypothetical protein
MNRGHGVLVIVFGCAWMTVGASQSLYAQTVAKEPAPTVCGADLAKRLAGTWRAPQFRMRRVSEFNAQVFGGNAFDVRDVEFALQPSGEGIVRISTSVVDDKKRTWAPTRIEANVIVNGAEPAAGGRCEPMVKVTSAQEQFLDETKYEAPIVGARIELLADPALSQLELRYEPPGGNGTFWTTMRRQTGR